MEEGYEDGEYKTSKYNSGLAQIQRIDSLWKDIHNQVKKGDYFEWNQILDIIWRELAGDLPDKSREESDMNDMNLKIAQAGSIFKPTQPGFNPISNIDRKKYAGQYLLLNKKEIFLRRLQNKLGKGSSFKDEYDDDFE